MLSDHDRKLIHQCFLRGPRALLEAGMTREEIRDFYANPEARNYQNLLQSEHEFDAIFTARARTVTRRDLSQLAQPAAAVLARALSGPDYLFIQDHEGNEVLAIGPKGRPIIRRPEPTQTQVRAAEKVLEGLGVLFAPNKIVMELAGEANIRLDSGVSNAAIVAHAEATTPSDRARSREKVRQFIEGIKDEIPELHRKVRVGIGVEKNSKPRRKPKR